MKRAGLPQAHALGPGRYGRTGFRPCPQCGIRIGVPAGGISGRVWSYRGVHSKPQWPLIQELAGTGIMVCTLNPSYTDTPLLKGDDFPRHIRWFKLSGLSDPDTIAREGIRAFKKGKRIYIPGPFNWFVHSVLAKFTPRIIADSLSRFAMQDGHY